jgi:hypothetical protein
LGSNTQYAEGMKLRKYCLYAAVPFALSLVMGCETEVRVESQSSSSSALSSSGSSGNGGEGGVSVSSSSSGNGGSGNGGAGGAGGGTSLCDEFVPIKLSAGSIQDMDQNGKWSPGESAVVNVIMTNTSSIDINYPGIQIESDHPGVTAAVPNNSLFLIGGTQMAELGVTFDADAAIPPGTVVTFTVTLHNIMNESCSDLPQLVLTAVFD